MPHELPSRETPSPAPVAPSSTDIRVATRRRVTALLAAATLAVPAVVLVGFGDHAGPLRAAVPPPPPTGKPQPKPAAPAPVGKPGKVEKVDPATLPPAKPGVTQEPFAETSPLSTNVTLVARLKLSEKVADYDRTGEYFELSVPESYSHDAAWGVVVWVPSGDRPALPDGWDAEFAARKLLRVALLKAGNGRNPHDRFRMAVDAVHEVRRRFHIDPKRVWIMGESGGGKIASIAAVAFPDVFAGVYTVNGVQFYRNVKGDPGKAYPGVYTPDGKALVAARRDSRIVIAANPMEPSNGLTAQRMAERGFKTDGFRSVKVLEALPKQGTSVALLKSALDFLDGGK